MAEQHAAAPRAASSTGTLLKTLLYLRTISTVMGLGQIVQSQVKMGSLSK